MDTKKRLLVCDDEPEILELVKACLSPLGYEVITTTNGEEVLDLVRKLEPHIILLDIVMSPITGFDVLVKLREFSQIPVIVFTARRDIAKMAMQEGANGFIAKPFTVGELVQVLDQTLKETGTPEKNQKK